MAAVVAGVVYGADVAPGAEAEQEAGAVRTLVGFIVVLLVGITAYMYINEGSWEGVLARLKQLREVEFNDLIDRGRLRDMIGRGEEDDEGEDE